MYSVAEVRGLGLYSDMNFIYDSVQILRRQLVIDDQRLHLTLPL